MKKAQALILAAWRLVKAWPLPARYALCDHRWTPVFSVGGYSYEYAPGVTHNVLERRMQVCVECHATSAMVRAPRGQRHPATASLDEIEIVQHRRRPSPVGREDMHPFQQSPPQTREE